MNRKIVTSQTMYIGTDTFHEHRNAAAFLLTVDVAMYDIKCILGLNHARELQELSNGSS